MDGGEGWRDAISSIADEAERSTVRLGDFAMATSTSSLIRRLISGVGGVSQIWVSMSSLSYSASASEASNKTTRQ